MTDNNLPDTNPQVMYENNGDILLLWCTETRDVVTEPNVVKMRIYRGNIVAGGSVPELVN